MKPYDFILIFIITLIVDYKSSFQTVVDYYCSEAENKPQCILYLLDNTLGPDLNYLNPQSSKQYERLLY